MTPGDDAAGVGEDPPGGDGPGAGGDAGKTGLNSDGDDPLERLERNERSTRDAVRYLGLSLLAVLAVALVMALALDVGGRPCPGHGQLCTTPVRVEIVLVPTALSVLLSVGALWQTYRRWRDLVRWRPWLFCSQLMWIATTAYLLISASIVFMR